MPDGCPIETPADEVRAERVGSAGITTLPDKVRRRAELMWQIAVGRAIDEHNVVLDGVEDAFLGLIVGRIAIVTDLNLDKALKGTIAMVDGLMRVAKRTGFGQPRAVFLSMALQENRHVFPYTD